MAESSGTGILGKIADTVKGVFGNWATYTTIGSFALYFLGYLALRFQLDALGVVTDLSVLDERYFFAGARFLLYLVTSLPIVLLLVAVFLPVLYVLDRFRAVHKLQMRLVSWLQRPNAPVLLGIVFSLLLIQIFMRKCFAFSSILLSPSLPEPGYLRDCVLAEDGGFINLFFSGILAGVLLNSAILYVVYHPKAGCGPAQQWLRNILIGLVGMEFLLLPINYGLLIVNRSLPRLADLGTPSVLNGRDAWLARVYLY
jgi:hypothetical protein